MSFLLNLADVESQFVKMSYNDNFSEGHVFFTMMLSNLYISMQPDQEFCIITQGVIRVINCSEK